MQDQALCALQRKETLVKEKERNLENAMGKKMEANKQTKKRYIKFTTFISF